MTKATATSHIARPVARLEDRRLLTGQGRFLEDLNLPGQHYATVLRSPYAHAGIVSLDCTQALRMPGVAGVFTGADMTRAGLGALPCLAPVTFPDGRAMCAPERHALAVGTVRFVGDAVALVVAVSEAAARSAAEHIEVEYAELPACVSPVASEELCFEWEAGDARATQAAFETAAQVCQIEVVNNRVAATPLETRGALGAYDPATGFTLYTQTQGVHLVRRALAEPVFGVPEERLRVVTGDVGGSFGMKIFAYPEHALVLFAARALGHPVKWVADRGEAFLCDAHGRDHVSTAELALDADGRFLALRAEITANMGAYLSTLAPMVPTAALVKVFGHVYDIGALSLHVRGVLTHTAPLDAYRGAGKPEITYLVERVIEKAARERRSDRVALRRMNLVPAAAMPYTTALGWVWDCGVFEQVLDQALARADWEGFEARRRESHARGLRRGIGLGMHLHASGGDTAEVSHVDFGPDGAVRVRTGTQSAGQGHETAFAQVVAARLEIPIERVCVVQGDTALIATGGGTGGSSSLSIGAATIARATERFLERARSLAAAELEAAEVDLEYGQGRFSVTGTDLGVALFALAESAAGAASGNCIGEAGFEGEHQTCPYGAYVCEVEIDPETGRVRIVRYTGVDDLGRVLNPEIAQGQIVGGLVQGIGQALLEHVRYDEQGGQLLSGSLLDYALPRADDLPPLVTDMVGAPTGNYPLGMKGAGEVGTIGGAAPVINAIIDALGHDRIEMPATAESVWRALNSPPE